MDSSVSGAQAGVQPRLALGWVSSCKPCSAARGRSDLCFLWPLPARKAQVLFPSFWLALDPCTPKYDWAPLCRAPLHLQSGESPEWNWGLGAPTGPQAPAQCQFVLCTPLGPVPSTQCGTGTCQCA